MKNATLKLAVIATFGLVSAQAMATGFLGLPTAGFAVTAGANQTAGTSAYIECNTTGNYGSGSYSAPTAGADNVCAVFPASNSIDNTPVTGAGFTRLTGSDLTNVVITANSQTLATMTSRTFRNTAATTSPNTQCIYGKRIKMSTSGTFDYNPQLSGSQRLEVNDVALGGFSLTPTVQAGYFHTTITDSPVFRMGRAFTSVQMQSNAAATLPSTNYIRRPLNSPAPAASTEINGVGQTLTPPGNPTAAQQTAAIRTNWVDFTQDVTGGTDEDGTTSPDTSMMYVQAACDTTAPASLTNSVRIRQTGQETQPFVTILAPGLARSGANANF